MEKAKQENKEVLMREKMQWWGFSELLNFNPKAGGVKMNFDQMRKNSTAVNPKSKTTFKEGSKAMKTKIFNKVAEQRFTLKDSAALLNEKCQQKTSNQNQEAIKMKPSAIFKVPLTLILKPLTLISKRSKAMKTKILKGEATKNARSTGVQCCLRPLMLTHLNFLTVTMLLLFLVSIPGNAGLKNVKAEEAAEFAPGVLMVKFAEGVKAEMEKNEEYVATGIPSIDALNRKHGVREFIKVFSPEPQSEKGRTAYGELGLDRVYRFAALPEADVQAMVVEYEADPNVEYAEPDYVGYGHYTPNDPSFGVQWGLYNTGFNPPDHPGTADADIDATEAWDSYTPQRNLILAILDTGVDIYHPDFWDVFPFVGVIWQNMPEAFEPGLDGVDDDGNGYVDDRFGFDFVNGTYSGGVWNNDANGPQDDHGHGTVNAGIAGALTNNGVGVAGVAGGSFNYQRIMAVKVLDSNNSGYYTWWSNGLYYAANNNAAVINMSMGGTDFSQSLQDAVNYAWNQGCVVVAAMGNANSSTPEYPAAFINTIAVGATDTDDSRCVPPDWQNFGMPNGGSNFGSHLDVVAPGNWIYSTVWNDTYGYWAGTSMAAPFVSGLAALIMMQALVRPSPDEVRDFIQSTAEDQVGLPSEDTPGWDQYYGWGRINACGAVEALPAPGDANGDGGIDLGDVVYLINYLYRNGPAPDPLWTGDANSDGVVDLGDVVYLINYLYREGPPPCSGKAGGSLANGSKLSGSLGHAEISLLLKSDPANENLTGFAKASPESFNEVSEISVVGKFDRDVAGVQLEIEFNPNEVELLDPVLTPLTKDIQLFSGIKNGTQKIGIVDLTGKNFILAGKGTLVNLQARGKDLTSIKIKKAILVGMDAVPLDLELSGELKLKEVKDSSPLKRDFQESTPQHFSLSQNYPNPFNPQTSIRYALPKDAYVRLIIYNILGQKVKTLVDERQPAGHKTVWWDGKDEKGDQVASGVYFYRLEAEKFSEVKKMMMVK